MVLHQEPSLTEGDNVIMLEVTKDTFEPEVLQAEGYVFVDFFGDGCVPCAALMPHVHALADKYADSS